MDPLQWMGAVRMSVQTHNSSPSINVLLGKKLLVCKKQIHD